MKTTSKTVAGRNLPVVAVLAALFLAMPARANLLTSTNETQLEAWLGQGDLNFANIFTKVAGDGQTSLDFHAAADGQGATFVLMSIFGGYPGHPEQIVGGYNPGSWNSSGTFNMTLDPTNRHAFIFNLTSGLVQQQNANGQGWSGFNNSGDFQTYNHSNNGPTFGAGFDLTTTNTLEVGSAYNFSYGGTSFGAPILWTPSGHSGNETFSIARMEIFTITSAPVSVPDGASTFGMMALSLAGLVALRRSSAAATRLRQA